MNKMNFSFFGIFLFLLTSSSSINFVKADADDIKGTPTTIRPLLPRNVPPGYLPFHGSPIHQSKDKLSHANHPSNVFQNNKPSQVPVQSMNPNDKSSSASSVPLIIDDSCILIKIRPTFFTQIIDPKIIKETEFLGKLQEEASQKQNHWECKRKEDGDETLDVCCCKADYCKTIIPQISHIAAAGTGESINVASIEWEGFKQMITDITPTWIIVLLALLGTASLVLLILFIILLSYVLGCCCFAYRKKPKTKGSETSKKKERQPSNKTQKDQKESSKQNCVRLPFTQQAASAEPAVPPPPPKPDHVSSKQQETPLISTDYSNSGKQKKDRSCPYTMMALVDLQSASNKGQQLPQKNTNSSKRKQKKGRARSGPYTMMALTDLEAANNKERKAKK